MKQFRTEFLAVIACAALGVGAVRRIALTTPEPAAAPSGWLVADLIPPDTELGQETRNAANTLERHNPFRFSRRPASVRHGELPVPPRPALAVPDIRISAVIGGPPWRALVSGLPGSTGSVVVDEGDKFGDLTVVRIVRDSAVIRSLDTTWTLVLPRGNE